MSTKQYNFCNNCENTGHVFHQCIHPITSIGIIAYRKDHDAVRYLFICRKDTFGYVDFIRGKYKLNMKSYIQNIFNEMTIQEKKRILTAATDNSVTFDNMWSDLWGDKVGIQYRGEEKVSREKFEMIKEGVGFGNGSFNIASIVDASTTAWTSPEWGFPKGRRNYNERDINCALREFEEETGLSSKGLKVLQNLQPYEETFTGSNYKSYKHSYFVAEAYECIPTNEGHQESEVSAVKWMTFNEAMDAIRPYNVEKRNVLIQVNKMLSQYRICS